MKQGKLLDYNWDQREQRLKKRYRPFFCSLHSQLYMVFYQWHYIVCCTLVHSTVGLYKCRELLRLDSELDVLWCQPIKLIQVVSTLEFHEYWWNDVDFIFFIPSIFCRASEASNWLLQKLSMKIFHQKFRFLIKNR